MLKSATSLMNFIKDLCAPTTWLLDQNAARRFKSTLHLISQLGIERASNLTHVGTIQLLYACVYLGEVNDFMRLRTTRTWLVGKGFDDVCADDEPKFASVELRQIQCVSAHVDLPGYGG